MPSEEEPQIIVPLADLYLPLPGAMPQEVENRVLVPLENVLSGIEGVEYVYGHAEPGFGLVTVRYEVGLDMEESLVKLYSTLMKNMDRMPPGLMFPLVKTVTIDDVPFFTATLFGGGLDGGELLRVAQCLAVENVEGEAGTFTADVESPVYAILDMEESLNQIEVAGGGGLGVLMSREPSSTERPVMKWDGEWQITYEVFRDLGIAFAGALVLIYVLIVAWFGSFVTPVVMMMAIPLTLIGIAPGHLMIGAFFTATSMIGMIALAGIMVRNGILLIDYLEARLEAGVPLERAIIEAGAVRTRPIVITAAAVIIGAFVILFDPIFQGLAVALVAGSVASTVLSLLVVPGIYFLMNRNAEEVTP